MVAAATSNLKKCSLELGGKSPLIVFDDCDLEQAIAVAQAGLFLNQGQVCCSHSRTPHCSIHTASPCRKGVGYHRWREDHDS